MGSMASSPKVSLLFPFGMATRHRASSLFSLLVLRFSVSLRLRISSYWASSWYGRIAPTWYAVVCRIDVTTATQLLINTTSFPLHRDIGTPRHWNPESKHRDIGTAGKCTGRGEGTDPRTGKGHRPKERLLLVQVSPGSHRRSLRCAFHCQAAHGGYDVLGRCTLVAGTVLVSLWS